MKRFRHWSRAALTAIEAAVWIVLDAVSDERRERRNTWHTEL